MKISLGLASFAIATAAFGWQAAPKVIPRPEGARFKAPQGFEVREFASGLQKPRIMLTAPGGEILVTESIPKGSVVVLAGTERKTLIAGLDRPYGMAWHKGYLYVAEPTSVKRYKYDPKTVSVGEGEEIFPIKDSAKGHWTRTLAFNPAGTKLYVGVGSSSNADYDPNDLPVRAAISECNPDGTGCQIYATGLRNPTTIGFSPDGNTLWASVQERDGLGDDAAPDFFTHIERGGFYGWPWAYFGPNEDPRHAGKRPELVKKTIVPDVSLGAHSAVIDWKFYTGKQFPVKYRGGAFLALRGSSSSSKRVGYSVVFVPFKKGKPSGKPEEFLSGWMLGEDQPEVWGRPTGVMVMNDGSLLVSDDGGNKIWHVSYQAAR